jgi:ABC-2 type transport system permease protein
VSANAVLTIAYRDFRKFLRDPMRIVSTLIFPVIFVVVLGGSLQENLGDAAGYNFLAFTFTGVFAQTLFQSTATGIVFLLEDRESDFMQEIFVAPISRYAILMGKIIGETLVAMTQGLALIPLALAARIPIGWDQAVALLPVGIICCVFGGAFGVLLVSRINSQRAAQQIFAFIFLPQFFLAGVFTPIKELPIYLEVLSRISPMRYAVDFSRGVFYAGHEDRDLVVLDPLWLNALVIVAATLAFIGVGTYFFVRAEQNR